MFFFLQLLHKDRCHHYFVVPKYNGSKALFLSYGGCRWMWIFYCGKLWTFSAFMYHVAQEIYTVGPWTQNSPTERTLEFYCKGSCPAVIIPKRICCFSLQFPFLLRNHRGKYREAEIMIQTAGVSSSALHACTAALPRRTEPTDLSSCTRNVAFRAAAGSEKFRISSWKTQLTSWQITSPTYPPHPPTHLPTSPTYTPTHLPAAVGQCSFTPRDISHKSVLCLVFQEH